MKLCIIDCEDQVPSPNTSYGEMFSNLLRSNDVEIDIIYVAKGEQVPLDIYSYNSYVLTGSHYNVRDNMSWYQDVISLIHNVAESSGQVRL